MIADRERRSRRARAILIAAVAGFLVAAAEAPTPPGVVETQGSATSSDGARFFSDRAAGPAKVACADCHLIENPALPPPDDLIRSGHTLFDAFGRGTWWNGRITTDCGEAAEVCLKRFQGAPELPPKMRTALVLYMKSHSAPVSNPIILMRVPPAGTDVNQGDAARGQDLFRRACSVCHAPGGSDSGPDLSRSKMTAREIADTTRAGKGRMPFFQGDILSNEQVADISVHAQRLQPPAP